MNLLIRFFYIVLKNLIFKRPLGTFDKSIIKLRVLPTDLDLNFHMNNGRYLTLMDIGRSEFLIRFGMLKVVLTEKLQPVAAGINIVFFKPLAPFAKYTLHTSVVSWDDEWFYLQQDFVKDKKVMARAVAKVAFLKKGRKLDPQVMLKKLNHLEAKPIMPVFLEELIKGEKLLVNEIKKINNS